MEYEYQRSDVLVRMLGVVRMVYGPSCTVDVPGVPGADARAAGLGDAGAVAGALPVGAGVGAPDAAS